MSTSHVCHIVMYDGGNDTYSTLGSKKWDARWRGSLTSCKYHTSGFIQNMSIRWSKSLSPLKAQKILWHHANPGWSMQLVLGAELSNHHQLHCGLCQEFSVLKDFWKIHSSTLNVLGET
jgi:hypothetical protein